MSISINRRNRIIQMLDDASALDEEDLRIIRDAIDKRLGKTDRDQESNLRRARIMGRGIAAGADASIHSIVEDYEREIEARDNKMAELLEHIPPQIRQPESQAATTVGITVFIRSLGNSKVLFSSMSGPWLGTQEQAEQQVLAHAFLLLTRMPSGNEISGDLDKLKADLGLDDNDITSMIWFLRRTPQESKQEYETRRRAYFDQLWAKVGENQFEFERHEFNTKLMRILDRTLANVDERMKSFQLPAEITRQILS